MPTLADLTGWIVFAQQNGDGGGGGGLFGGMLLPLVMIAVLFYLMLIRPERRKRAQHAAMLDAMQKNDKVVTIGGIYGTIVNIQKESKDVTIKVDENTRLRMLRSSIASVIVDEDADEKKAS